MEKLATSSFRLGILGGGQLGRMLALAAANWDIQTYCLDKSEHAPARNFCHGFQKGLITSFDDVVSLAKNVDMVTIETDHANADALAFLEEQGLDTNPASNALRIIQDKGLQRQFCLDRGIPVPKFQTFSSDKELSDAVTSKIWNFPFIVKARSAGYDGKGVFLVHDHADLEKIPAEDLMAEELVDIKKELAVIAVRNGSGQISSYPPSELFMESGAYLVRHLMCPADIPEHIQNRAKELSHALIEAFDMKGLLAIEMFLDNRENLWINECSPRPHNSGHHTIEGAYTSQYEQHLRGIFNLPLGSCELIMPSAMINILGDVSGSGPACYEGLTECLKIDGVNIHIYGKKDTTPRRKMGHITVLSSSYQKLECIVEQIEKQVRVRPCEKKTLR
jgi:5-(carboxyamino)imidazole ribonucleotide synthase